MRATTLLVALSLPALSPHPALAVSQGGSCGGFIGIRCDGGLWCEMPARACGLADGKGTCVRVPDVCMQQYKPVCGCNGQTYANDCLRRQARVTFKADGRCR